MAVSTKKPISGFTLIELMIVVAIVGILLAVGIPGYQSVVQKGRRAEAKTALMDMANRQERLMLDRSLYTTDLADLGYQAPFESENGRYALSAVACTDGRTLATCFNLRALPVANRSQAKDLRCTGFFLNSDGEKTATGSTPNQCW